MKNTTTGLMVIAILIFIGLGCSSSDTKTADNTTANKTADNSSKDKKPTTSSDAKTSGGDIAGDYSITGENLSGQKYDGDLTIKKQGDVYQFSWNAGGSTYDGVGVSDGNLVAVGYGAGNNGKGCGSAIYKLGGDSLFGKLGGWGYSQAATQTATRIKKTKDGDLYSVNGTDTDGSEYRGNLYISFSKSDVYHFAYSGGKVQYVGTGIKVGDYFGAGLGVKQCGYVVYDISKGDRLEAAWGIVGDDRLGKEIATRK